MIRGVELADRVDWVALEHHQARDTVGRRLEVPVLAAVLVICAGLVNITGRGGAE